MSVTVSQVVSAGLKAIIVLGAEASLEASDAQDFIFAMNNFMADLEANGIELGYTPVSNLGDTVTVPPGALRGIISCVAIEVAPDYGGVVTPALQRNADSGMKTLRQLGVNVRPSAFPSTLPVGSGNEDSNYFGYDHFYPDLEGQILAEVAGSPYALLSLSSNTTATTITSTATGVLVAGTWNVDRTFQVSATSAGRMTYTSTDDVIVNLQASLTVEPATAADQIVSAYFVVNGVIDTDTRQQVEVSASAALSIQMDFRKKLEKNDYVEVYIANETSTDNLLVSEATLRVN